MNSHGLFVFGGELDEVEVLDINRLKILTLGLKVHGWRQFGKVTDSEYENQIYIWNLHLTFLYYRERLI